MARSVIAAFVDDIDATPAHETVTFGYRGATYEIALSRRNVAVFDRALAPFVRCARRKGRTGARSPDAVVQVHKDAAAVRAWAQANGYQVPRRGRIPWGVREAYEAAHAPDEVLAAAGA